MNAEIIAVGTELLLGDILNTNAQYLSQRLMQAGINVFYQSVVGDNPARLQNALKIAKERCDVLVITGGLGHTEDDLTKQTVAEVFNDTLVLDNEELAKIKSFFEKSGRTTPKNNEKQAFCPVRGKKIVNENGTAPGAIFEDNGCYAVLLPGPPSEMRPMFEKSVEPWLSELGGAAMYSRVLRVAGIGESHLEEQIKNYLNSANPTCALYAKTGEVIIRVTARMSTKSEAQESAAKMCGELYKLLGNNIYGEADEGIEHAVVKLLLKNNMSLATAESCTGGMLSARITEVSGSSSVFKYGVCTYANEAKSRLLGVSEKTLQSFGAVSEQTAEEMARGIASLANADIGIGITGVAGPTGGTPEKPVGLVYISAYYKGKAHVQKMLYENRSRAAVREVAVQRALNLARLLLLEDL